MASKALWSSSTLLLSSKQNAPTVLKIHNFRRTTTWAQSLKYQARKASIRCSGNTNHALRTCKNCKTQFDPLLNHPRACRFHTAHFGEFQQRQLPLFQVCSRSRSLDATKCLHALTITMGTDQPVFVNNNLVSLYASLGELPIARNLFERMPERNAVSYNTIITAHTRNGLGEEAWELFSQMMASEFSPTQYTFGSLLSLPSLDLQQGFQLQSLILKTGLICADAFSGTALLGLFGRHGSLEEASKLFEEMPRRNIVTWNSLISAFSQWGSAEDSMILFRELLSKNILPSEYSFVGVLSGVGRVTDFKSGEQIHGLVIKFGSIFYPSVANSLLSMYVKCYGTCLAAKVFEDVLFRDVVSWNVIIGAFIGDKRPEKALELFLTMILQGFLPSQTTFVNAICSCSNFQIPIYGKFIHAKTIKNNFKCDVFVGTALVDFYMKYNALEEAHICFDEIYEKNMVSWNALISGYAHNNSPVAVNILQTMLYLGYQPNEFSFSVVLKVTTILELRQLHCLIIRLGYLQNQYALSSLIASYAANGQISDALTFATTSIMPLPVVPSNIIAGIYNRCGQYIETQKWLSQIDELDIVSWNILIAACARNGDYKEVLNLFRKMQMCQIMPDNYTFVSLISICSGLCNLALGSSIHGLIIKTDFRCCDVFVCNLLVDMYAKCGSLQSSVKIFNEMTDKNIFSWTALISALGLHGYAHEALERFREMESLGFKPDGVTFMSALSACRHGGLVEEGMELFKQMKESHGIEPEMDHYVCAVDLLTRYGHLDEAGKLISSMPIQPNAIIWRTYLEGYKRFTIQTEK
ncbi:PREDICTED: pentatricopeptide repeat-containing protein At3g58590 isoform X2 [Nelumbo nucifera]|uniref:Pentatricopeptide repeat-containing protein At3g58590 isoform X2 n=1 Tax=Nelumbo nucifera TaxID=4432 RepID=A0A1U8QB77_NELNU|nr:PREDICTED: pentatricopeptide repeat-containing protein At3g58590 isoform X2 [Nelumbo nucifera]